MNITISMIRRNLRAVETSGIDCFQQSTPHTATIQAPLNNLLQNCTRNDKKPINWSQKITQVFKISKESFERCSETCSSLDRKRKCTTV